MTISDINNSWESGVNSCDRSDTIIDISKHISSDNMATNKFTDEASYDNVQSIVNFLTSKTKYKPTVGIVCGSGLGGLAAVIEDAFTIKYEDIPGFPVSTVPGHVGQLVFGTLSGKEVVAMQGRFHSYEGYQMSLIALPVRVMKLIGVEVMIVTNACGGLNDEWSIGDVMIMDDHINMLGLAGKHPLVGPNDERFGPRFPPMSNAYDLELQSHALTCGDELGFSSWLRSGVYAFVSGPNYETAAESRFLKMCGADVVGMSTVPEVICAHHCGIRCVGFSLVTNVVVMDKRNSTPAASHEEVLESGQKRSKDLQKLITLFVSKI